MEYLSSALSWWFSVFLAGIFISLTAAYLKPLVDRLASTIWANARDLNQEWKTRWLREVRELASNPHKKRNFETDMLTRSNDRVYSLIFGLLLALMSQMMLIAKLLLAVGAPEIDVSSGPWPYVGTVALASMVVGFMFVMSAVVSTFRLNRMKEKLSAARKLDAS